MFGQKQQQSGRELGEHEAMNDLHRARVLKQRAEQAKTAAVRLDMDADDALSKARREVRRASER